mmetsp:Transcript_9014/g.16481  ORF Transcript_9014/g.16481 Transcript_9014/m.16481 type:complete len:198 (+) Transcript_9014:95-688(+)
MNCVIGVTALILGLLGVRVTRTRETEASVPLWASPADDSVFSLLQVSGQKRVAGKTETRRSRSRRSRPPVNVSDVQPALVETNVTELSETPAPTLPTGQAWPLSLLSISLCRVVEQVAGHEVPTKEGMMFTASMIAAIIVLSVCIAMLHQSSARDVRSNRLTTGGIPGAVEETVRDFQEKVEDEFTTGMRKPKPACC